MRKVRSSLSNSPVRIRVIVEGLTAAQNGRAGRGSYANTTAMGGRIYRLDEGEPLSGPYSVDKGSIWDAQL